MSKGLGPWLLCCATLVWFALCAAAAAAAGGTISAVFRAAPPLMNARSHGGDHARLLHKEKNISPCKKKPAFATAVVWNAEFSEQEIQVLLKSALYYGRFVVSFTSFSQIRH